MATMAAPRHRFPDEILMIESSVASSSPVSCRLPLVGGALLLLAACGDGGGELAAPGTPDGGSGDVAALVHAYHDVVVADPRFDECWQGAPAAPGRCLRGPRSGSGLGDAVHEWIRTELSAIPELTHVQRQPFNFPRYRVRTVGLEADLGDGVEAVSAFPWFGQGVTPAEGLRAPLARVGLPLIGNPDVDGRVALMRFSRQFNADAADTHETLRAAEASGALAAVVTFDAPGNLIAAHNYDIQYPLAEMPTVIVGRQDFNRLATAASRGEEARLTLTADAVTGVVDNSIALLPGQDPRLLIIGTPMNTWVGGGGERAPGAAITVALARHLAARARNEGPLPYSVMFVATGGHEVYGYGLERALNCVNPDGVLAYIHLGAGLVSRGGMGWAAVAGGLLALGFMISWGALRLGSITATSHSSAVVPPSADSAGISPTSMRAPSETIDENPVLWVFAQDSVAFKTAPDREKKAMSPLPGTSALNSAFSPFAGTEMPRLPGPISRSVVLRAASRQACMIGSGQSSYPGEGIRTARVPRTPRSSITLGRCSALAR